jgi:CRP-like cAMP-binding protein
MPKNNPQLPKTLGAVRDEAQLSAIDKVLCLQNVDLFRYATTEMLAYISSIAHESRVEARTVIFSEQDLSDSMYVVVSGKVRLEKEGREVLIVDACQSFGTWALLDPAPRMMSAVAVVDTLLLKISRNEFYDFLADHEEVTPAIFKSVIERVKNLAPD